jgi:hypothetical protein
MYIHTTLPLYALCKGHFQNYCISLNPGKNMVDVTGVRNRNHHTVNCLLMKVEQ